MTKEIKNYIAILNQDEKTILFDLIPGERFKIYYTTTEKGFSQICKGFRPNKLNGKTAKSIARRFLNTKYISNCINITVTMFLKEIEDNIAKLEENGLSHDIALAQTMLGSYFVNNVDLYFKLADKDIDEASMSELYKRMKYIKSGAEQIKSPEEINNHLKEENNKLLKEIKAKQEEVNTTKASYELKIQTIESERDTYKSERDTYKRSLDETQTKIDILMSSSANKNEAEILAKFDDTNSSVLPSVDIDEIVSLCEVVTDNGIKRLVRYADLSHDGCFQVFCKNEDILPYFNNRYKLYYNYKDSPFDDGFYGIWAWSAAPNKNDPSKDYVSSRHVELDAIEIVTIKEALTLDDLINYLKKVIEFKPHTHKTMFAFNESNDNYIGVLCRSNELKIDNEKTTFGEDCIEVPVYKFSTDNILRLDNGLSFYRNAFAGLPSRLYQLKRPIEIVKKSILESISWNTYKNLNVTRAQCSTFKKFLSAIPVEDITCRIETKCRCSNSDAKELLNDFFKSINKYINEDSIEDEIILSSFSANTKFQERTKALIRTDWEAENRKLMTDAQTKLNSLETKIKAAEARLIEVQESFNKTKLEEKRLTGIIAEKNKLADDVDSLVADRIQKARKNAADFIANMAFIGGQPINAKVEETQYHTFSVLDDLSDLEEHHSWSDVINTAVSELIEAGVAKDYCSGLAAFLCAAYIENQPILLVGPNAIDIIQALCSTIGQKYGMLCCESNYSNQVITDIGVDGEKVVIINNLIASGWMNRLPEILSQKDVLYVATHPYAVDIQVEPKSLFGFMLPLFTEFFVNEKATGKYFGGYLADDFEKYSESKSTSEDKDLRILSKFSLSPLVKNRINRLVMTMHGIYPDITTDEKFLYAVLPIAYASGAMNELKEAIADPQKGISISASLKRDLQYVLGEI